MQMDKFSFKPLKIVKWVILIILALFVTKLFVGWVAAKWPNAVTHAANTVVQSA